MPDKVLIRVPNYEDILDRISRFSSFTVAERIYTADLLIPQLTIRTTNLLAESSACGALILYWGLEAARARRHHAQVSAAYRSWRDRTWLQLKQTPLESGKMPTDGHAEKLYRCDPEYGTWRARMDDAQYSAECAEAVQEAFKAKAQLLKLEGSLLHDEAGGAYYVAEDARQEVIRQPQTAPAGGDGVPT